MIVDEGKKVLLDFQLSSLGLCYWALFTSNTTISNTTVYGDLAISADTGLTPQASSSWGTSAVISHVAVSLPTTNPVWVNGSGSSKTIYGWALLNSSQNKIIAAVNVGSTSIANGASYSISASITDNQA